VLHIVFLSKVLWNESSTVKGYFIDLLSKKVSTELNVIILNCTAVQTMVMTTVST